MIEIYQAFDPVATVVALPSRWKGSDFWNRSLESRGSWDVAIGKSDIWAIRWKLV
jgi:hypothetical protein